MGEIEHPIIIVGDFTPLISMDKSFRQKVHKETLALKDTLDKIDYTHTHSFLYTHTRTHI